jgi:transposase InsO family protein
VEVTFASELDGAEACNADGQVQLKLCVDSGATHIITPDASFLDDYQEISPGETSVALAAADARTAAVGFGTLTLRSNSTGSTLVFRNALHVPDSRRTLVCLGKAMRSGVHWHFDANPRVSVQGRGFWGSIVLAPNDLLFLDAEVVRPRGSPKPSAGRATAHALGRAEICHAVMWHERLGHPGRKAMTELARRDLIPASAAEELPAPCETCIEAKQRQTVRAPPTAHTARVLQRVHVDLVGPIKPVGSKGERYALGVSDDFSGFLDVIPLVRKSDAGRALVECMRVWERQTQPRRLEELASDQGGEFINAFLQAWERDNGVGHRTSPAYTPKSNGRPERANGVFIPVTRALMLARRIPPDLWPEVVRCGSAYLLNRRPRFINKRWVIPAEVFYGRPVSLQHLRVIGSECRVLIKPAPREKFAARSERAILLGYTSAGRGATCVYRVFKFGPPSRITDAVDVVFVEQTSRPWMLTPAAPGGAIPGAGGAILPQVEGTSEARQANAWSRGPGDAAPALPVPGDRRGGEAGDSRGHAAPGAVFNVPVLPLPVAPATVAAAPVPVAAPVPAVQPAHVAPAPAAEAPAEVPVAPVAPHVPVAAAPELHDAAEPAELPPVLGGDVAPAGQRRSGRTGARPARYGFDEYVAQAVEPGVGGAVPLAQDSRWAPRIPLPPPARGLAVPAPGGGGVRAPAQASTLPAGPGGAPPNSSVSRDRRGGEPGALRAAPQVTLPLRCLVPCLLLRRGRVWCARSMAQAQRCLCTQSREITSLSWRSLRVWRKTRSTL